ncbi:hypothetical protein IFM89_015501 [Coptis chinensis]|uniref:TraB domain-containing protein n=1 Tax=Coptis chinensis TaxID=261450 RepID=A0A835LEE6_9MAGN|nr:hypothetical protein IFM89_015501 [Coptis chinensis]
MIRLSRTLSHLNPTHLYINQNPIPTKISFPSIQTNRFIHNMENDRKPETPIPDDFVHVTIEKEESSVVSDDVEEREEKRVLPDELAKGVVLLECESSAEGGVCQVYLVGTAHVSQESCREVEAIISYLKPQVVFLELCSSRVAILTPQSLQVFRTVAPFTGCISLYHGLLTFVMPNKTEGLKGTNPERNDTHVEEEEHKLIWSSLQLVANKLEVFPGSEFRVAFEEAMKYGGKVILGDRPVQITLRRTWGKMTLWHKVKFLYSMLFQAMFLPSPEDLNKMLKEMDDVDMLTLVIQEMSKAFPTLMETLVHERDLFMSSTLLRVAREHTSVVAVVGRGHLQGIKKHWKQPIEVKDLLEIPARKSGVSAMRIITSLGVAIAGVAIVSGIYIGGKR